MADRVWLRSLLVGPERPKRVRCAGHRLRSLLRLLIGVAGVTGACFGRTATQPASVSMGNVLAGELQLAKQEFARSEYDEAAARLSRLAQAVPAPDPIGAEARSLLARIYFELGVYGEALATARQVPLSAPGGVEALEVAGITNLFQCSFDEATTDLWTLASMDEGAGLTWLGVLDAWLGRDASAESRLGDVARRFGATDEAPLARFYLTQLYLWGGAQARALRVAAELESSNPGYLASLRTRADNWLQRGAHLMRTFFTFDTLSRLARARGDYRQATSDSDRASAALTAMERAGGGCADQAPRLRAAWDDWTAVLAAAAPVADRDGDGIGDARDRCPDEAETFNAVADDDGCPDSAAIELRGNQILISSGFAIYFATGSDEILPTSKPVIDALVAMLKNPRFSWIRKIRIDGHTDDVGDEAANQDLSVRRAVAVGRALTAAGVPLEMTEGYGFGESRPVIRGTTEEARAANRRVEIFVTDPPIFGGARRR